MANVPKNIILTNDKASVIMKNQNPMFYLKTIETVTIQQNTTIQIPSIRLRCLKKSYRWVNY